MRAKVEQAGYVLEAYQSNHEGDLIDALQRAYSQGGKGILFNPGALTHYAYALHDAVEMKTIPVVEVHFSNIEQREPWRAISVIAPVVDARFFGEGITSYERALTWLSHHKEDM
jgi:3-dehydroquinate dehydratase II